MENVRRVFVHRKVLLIEDSLPNFASFVYQINDESSRVHLSNHQQKETKSTEVFTSIHSALPVIHCGLEVNEAGRKEGRL